MRTRTKKVSVHIEADLYQALCLKAAETGRSVSDVVNEAVRLNFAEDDEDLSAFEQRRSELNLDCTQFVKMLKSRSKI